MTVRTALLGSLFVAGTLLSAGNFAEARNADLPKPPPHARSYLCFEGNSASEVMRKANEAGARGWKMVSASGGHTGSIWCFEQHSITRPQR